MPNNIIRMHRGVLEEQVHRPPITMLKNLPGGPHDCPERARSHAVKSRRDQMPACFHNRKLHLVQLTKEVMVLLPGPQNHPLQPPRLELTQQRPKRLAPGHIQNFQRITNFLRTGLRLTQKPLAQLPSARKETNQWHRAGAAGAKTPGRCGSH